MEDFGEGKEKLTWRSETHELGRRTGNCWSKLCFRDENIFTPPPITLYRGSNLLHLLELLLGGRA
jgi:hypothetical protein